MRRTNNYSTPRKYQDSISFLALLLLSSEMGHLEAWVLGSGLGKGEKSGKLRVNEREGLHGNQRIAGREW